MCGFKCSRDERINQRNDINEMYQTRVYKMFSQNLVLIASFQPAHHFDFHPKSRTAMSPTRESIFPPAAMEVSSGDPDILGPNKYQRNCIENH